MLAIAPDRVAEFAALCARERAPWAQLGTATPDGQLVLDDRRGGAGARRHAARAGARQAAAHDPRARAACAAASRRSTSRGASIAEALDRVLGLPTVADKTFLVTIGDRTVGGLVARDPMIGRYQVPVADCALTTAGFDTNAGEVMAIGERPPVALLDAAAASRLAIGEAITNLAGAPIGTLGAASSCRATGWPLRATPARTRGSTPPCARASETAVALGIAIPVGKDSMSMRTQWDGKAVVSPVTLVVTAFGPVTDVTQARHARAARRRRAARSSISAAARAGSAARASRRCSASSATRRPISTIRSASRAFFAAMQTLVAARHAHRVSRPLRRRPRRHRARDGVRVGPRPRARPSRRCTPIRSRALFAEELGAIIEVAAAESPPSRRRSPPRAPVHAIGRAVPRRPHPRRPRAASRARRDSRTSSARAGRTSRTRSRAAATTRRAPTRSTRRASTRQPGPHRAADVRSGGRIAAPCIAKGARPRVAILREQGVNGQIEMAAAFTRAGFEAVDVHMTDLIEGRVDLADIPRRGRVRRVLVRRRARRRPRLGRDVPLQRARADGDSRSSSTATTRSCSACATAARWSPTSRRTSSPRRASTGRGSCATAASGSRRAS